MPRKKPRAKYKGKTGRHDFVEDFIQDDAAAELVAESYKEREMAWKKKELERKIAIEKWKENYRRRRAEQLQLGLNENQNLELMNQKMTWLLEQTLTPEAFEWLDALRMHDPECCSMIVKQILDNDSMAAIDDIIRVVYESGGAPMENRINLHDLVKNWRTIKGIKGKIQVQGRDGNLIDLSDYVRESSDWREEDE